MANREIDEEIKCFFIKHYPKNPTELLDRGVNVPFPYLTEWYQTYGCNNWRKNHGLPLRRKTTHVLSRSL